MDYGFIAKSKFEVLETRNFDTLGVEKGRRNFGFSIPQIYFWRDPYSMLRVRNPFSGIRHPCSGIRNPCSGFRNVFSYHGLRIPDNGLRMSTSP